MDVKHNFEADLSPVVRDGAVTCSNLVKIPDGKRPDVLPKSTFLFLYGKGNPVTPPSANQSQGAGSFFGVGVR